MKKKQKILTMDEKIEKLVERARHSARGQGGSPHDLTVEGYQQRIEETTEKIKEQEDLRDEAELYMGEILAGGCSEADGDKELAKINKIEKSIRKTRSTLQSYILRLGARKREDMAFAVRQVAFLERYGVESERVYCDQIDKDIENLSKSCHELDQFKRQIDYARYALNGAGMRPNHSGYAISQALIKAGMNEFLHLGVKNLSFRRDGLFSSLHPSGSIADAMPPEVTPEDRQQELQALIAQKHREVEERRDEEDGQQEEQIVDKDEKPVSETQPLPADEELSQIMTKAKDD